MMQDRRALADTLHREAVQAAREGRYEAARDAMRQALELGGGLHAPAERGLLQRNLAEVNRRLGRTREAVAAGQAAVRLLGRDAPALLNLGIALADAGQDEPALTCFEEALSVDPDQPDSHLARSEIFLRRGEFAAGWAEYAWRTRMPHVRPVVPPFLLARIGAPAWQGAADEPLLLVVAEQGLGDMIFFARFLPWAVARCQHMALYTPPAVAPLLAQLAPLAASTQDWNEIPAFTAWCALADLPRLAGDLQPAVPYLSVPDRARPIWQASLDQAVPPASGRKRVGLVWSGESAQVNNFARSVPLERLASLAAVPGVDWISLQKGEGAAQITAWPGRIADLAPGLHDFADTAALLSCLDLTVTVDTSVANLAGALGLPAWVMLRHRADWRWGEEGVWSRWYPSARLFRQARPGDWEGVAACVSQALGAAS